MAKQCSLKNRIQLELMLNPRSLGADQLITSVPTRDQGLSLAKQPSGYPEP